MRSKCLESVPKEPIAMTHKWQVTFCDGDFCAALLLNFFSYWHDIKCEQAGKATKINDVAQNHGDERLQDESFLQFHTVDDLSEGILGAFGRTKIMEAIALLKSKGVISTHSNPNPRYKFDKTTYYLFYPEVCNKWLNTYKNKIDSSHRNPVIPDSSEINNRALFSDIDSSDLDYRASENGRSSFKNGCSSSENRQAITETTAEITNKAVAASNQNYSIASHDKKAAAAFLSENDHVIGDVLSEAQYQQVYSAASQYLHCTSCKTVTELVNQVQAAMLNPSSFKQAGRDFIYKLSIIKKMLREKRWTPPVCMLLEKKSVREKLLKEVDEKIHEQITSIQHCERMMDLSSDKLTWQSHLDICHEQHRLHVQEKERLLTNNGETE